MTLKGNCLTTAMGILPHQDLERAIEHHDYRPDFIVRLRRENGQEVNLILELKGFEREQDRTKEASARRWVKAVNYHGGFGKWAWAVAQHPREIENILERTVVYS